MIFTTVDKNHEYYFLRLNINSWCNATFYFSCHFLIWQFFTHSSSRRLLYLFPPAMTLIIIMWKFIEPIFFLTFFLSSFSCSSFFHLNDVYEKRQIREMHDKKRKCTSSSNVECFWLVSLFSTWCKHWETMWHAESPIWEKKDFKRWTYRDFHLKLR